MDDLTGTAEQRAEQLTRMEGAGTLSPEWLTRQLRLVLEAWAADDTTLRIQAEGHEDY